MNRYEKSITMLNSALNMLHRDCPEHAECLIEIARCRRLLAVNKNIDYKEEALRSFVNFLNYKVPLEEKKDS